MRFAVSVTPKRLPVDDALFHRLADLALKKLDPELKKPRPGTPPGLKRVVLRRDGWRCTYQAPDGRKCLSQFALQVDHVVPLLGEDVMRLSLRVER